jgi:hypothetical protein
MGPLDPKDSTSLLGLGFSERANRLRRQIVSRALAGRQEGDVDRVAAPAVQAHGPATADGLVIRMGSDH